jgi:hypothetical protein
MLVLVVKLTLAALLTLAVGAVVRERERVHAFFVGKRDGWVVLLWVLLRLVPFGLLYGLAGYAATSDLTGFYNGAVAARQGLVPYRDFVTVYAPLYAYLTALPTLLWDDARSIILLMMLVEGLILWGTYRLYRLPLFTVLLYLLLPAALMNCVIGGQEDIWMWGFGLLTVAAMQHRERAFAAGLVLGLALVVTKALFVLLVPVVFFWVSGKVRLVAGMLAVGLPVLAVLFYLGGWSFLMPVQLAQEPLSPNLWSVLHPVLGDFFDKIPPKLFNYAALLGVVGVSTAAVFRWKQRGLSYAAMLLRAWVLVFSLIMLLVPSAYAVYGFAFALPLVAGGLPGYASGRPLFFLLLFNFLSVLQPSAWWRLGQPFYQFSDLTTLSFLLEYAMQVGIVGCLLYFVGWLWSGVSESG